MKNEVFFSDFLVNKCSRNQKFYIIRGPTIAKRVPNMNINFVRIGPVVSEKRSTQHEKSGFEKNAFSFYQ